MLHFRSESQPISTNSNGCNRTEITTHSFEYKDVKEDHVDDREKSQKASYDVSTRKNDLINGDSEMDADDENFKKGFTKMRILSTDSKSTRVDLSSTKSGVPSTEGEKISLNDRTLMSSQMIVINRDYGPEVKKNYHQIKKLDYIRKSIEIGMMIFILGLLCIDERVRQVIRFWNKELAYLCVIILILNVSYESRIPNHTRIRKGEIRSMQSTVSTLKDITPILYPSFIPILVSLLVFRNQPHDFGASIILALTSIPASLVPSYDGLNESNTTHWVLSLIPLIWKRETYGVVHLSLDNTPIRLETLALLSPLNQSLCSTLAFFTSTSLLPTELQLLSVALINLLLYARSPQAIILKSLLWGCGITILVSCYHVLNWSIILSRTPKWRFRHSKKEIYLRKRKSNNYSRKLYIKKQRVSGPVENIDQTDSDDASDFIRIVSDPLVLPRSNSLGSLRRNFRINQLLTMQPMPDMAKNPSVGLKIWPVKNRRKKHRSSASISRISKRILMLGRRKKKPSPSERSLYSLSLRQATIRKWLYAAYVYLCVLLIILIGIRKYVEKLALYGSEPIGWALVYLFGDLQIFREFVNSRNLYHWIQFPQPNLEPSILECKGLIEHWRLKYIGEANARIMLVLYWLTTFIIGLTIVLRFFSYVEVDTRRKFYHFLMVAVLLPTTFIDPTFTAIALCLALAIFLLLELFRSTRLPPLSKPLANFLAPFVDGRDLKGPIIVSHIFLLVGSAIPFWLTLGSLPRLKSYHLNGWIIETRELSMVSGVICVGLGDAAASLIGRRYGRRKWCWGQDKSLEGSFAFAAAVLLGLVISKVWLKLGGWQSNNNDSYTMTFFKSGIAACVASIAEAAIKGVNDNVIVPIILWLCVKGLNI